MTDLMFAIRFFVFARPTIIIKLQHVSSIRKRGHKHAAFCQGYAMSSHQLSQVATNRPSQIETDGIERCVAEFCAWNDATCLFGTFARYAIKFVQIMDDPDIRTSNPGGQDVSFVDIYCGNVCLRHQFFNAINFFRWAWPCNY